MSLLFMVRKSAPAHAADAQDAKGDEVIAQKNGYKLVYNTLNDGYWFYTKSGAGWGLTATNKVAAVNEFNRLVDSAKDSAASVDSNAEAIVNHDRIPVDQLGGEANARKHGYIIAKKGGRVYGVHIDGYSDKLAKKTIEEAGYTVVGDDAEDAAEFKVGDKVYWGLSNGIVTSINGNEVTVKTQNGREEKVFVEAIHGIDPKGSFDNSAMDDLNDGIKTIENKARALIADAKNARSKYAEILARSEIAKNNAQVKKTFEDDIARCDKLINALKAI